jgi:hypothetical protein
MTSNILKIPLYRHNYIGDDMVSVLTLGAVGHVFEPRSGQAKNIKLVFVACSTKE